VARIDQQQRERALERVQDQPPQRLAAAMSALPSFAAIRASAQRKLALGYTEAELARAIELLKDPAASKFVLAWLRGEARLVGSPCDMPAAIPFPARDVRLAQELTSWALSN